MDGHLFRYWRMRSDTKTTSSTFCRLCVPQGSRTSMFCLGQSGKGQRGKGQRGRRLHCSVLTTILPVVDTNLARGH